MKYWILSCALVGLFNTSISQSTHLQFIHCSPDTALKEVDIWIDTTLVIDNFNFRTSSPRIALDSGQSVIISLCPPNSIDTASSYIKDTILLGETSLYQSVINGFITQAYPSYHPLFLLTTAAKNTADLNGYSDFRVYNGSPDLGIIDVGIIANEPEIIAQDLTFDTISSYNAVEGFSYILRLSESGNEIVIRDLEFFLGNLQLIDSAFTVVITGFKDRPANFNGPAVDFHIVRNQGGFFIPMETAFARIQLVNNVADYSVSALDFYINGNLSSDNLSFRNGTGLIEVPSGLEVEIVAANSSSTTANDSLIRIDQQLVYGEVKTLVLNGLVDETITPFSPLEFNVFDSRGAANAGYNIDLMWIHGSTDAGQVALIDVSEFDETIFQSSNFGTQDGYKSLPAANYNLELRNTSDQSVLLEYDISYSSQGGSARTWILSGFSDTNNTDSTHRLGIFSIDHAGGEMKELNNSTGINEYSGHTIRTFPNPTRDFIYVENNNETLDYEIYSIDGALNTSGIISGNTRIEVGFLKPGIYSIVFKSGDWIDQRRLILVK